MKFSEITMALERPTSFWKEPTHHVKKLAQFGLLAVWAVGSGLFATKAQAINEFTLTVKTTAPIDSTRVIGEGISCGSPEVNDGGGRDCIESYSPNTEVTLTATRVGGYYHPFRRWGGDCTGTSSSITITMDRNKNCVAIFYMDEGTYLNINVLGKGLVTSNDGTINCRQECEAFFPDPYSWWVPGHSGEEVVILTATPDMGFRFKEWKGYCSMFSSSTSSTITVERDESRYSIRYCKAIFVPTCDVVAYVVHDGGLNDSLLLSVSNPDFHLTPIGSVHPGYDLEALALHPQTYVLYASSGENTEKRGYLYKVEGENVVELGQPGDFSGGLEGLSFNPSTNDLWGWAQGKGLVKFNTLEPHPSASQVLAYAGEIQDLTWSPQGDVLYAVENRPQGGKNKVILWAYHPTDGNVVAQCEKELEGWQEVEALQTLPSGALLFGLHNSKKLLTGTLDPNQGCQVGNIQEIPVPYDDIEGIALMACPLEM